MQREGLAQVVLSLCDRTGNWPRYYTEAGGYEVVSVDLTRGGDVRHLEERADLRGRVRGILAAPPCTCFCRSGCHVKRTPEQMSEALAVVDACLRAVAIYRPAWWALENPPGKLSKYLGPHAFEFQPWQFGDAYSKRTLLWGSFTAPTPGPVVDPTRRIDQMYSGQQEKAKGLRSATPLGFARAFYNANP